MLERAGALFRQIERLIHGQPLDPNDPLQIGVCRYLLSNGVTKDELEQLQKKILNHEWDSIPLLFFHAALGNLLDYDMLRERKYQVNDEFDRFRVSVAFYSSATIMTDRQMAVLVRRL